MVESSRIVYLMIKFLIKLKSKLFLKKFKNDDGQISAFRAIEKSTKLYTKCEADIEFLNSNVLFECINMLQIRIQN